MSKNSTIKEIAAKQLGLTTLDTQKNDSLDFHSLGVWAIRSALDAAYEAGKGSMETADIAEEGSGCWVDFTIDEAVDHLRAWLAELDDPVRIARLFDPICGCSHVFVVNGTLIRTELP